MVGATVGALALLRLMLGHGIDTGDILCLTGEMDGGFRGCLGWLGGELLGNFLGGGANVAGGMDGEISGFLGRVGSEFLGIPLGEGAFKTGAIEERGPSGDLLSLGGIDPGSGGVLVGASSVEFLPGDDTGAGASGTTTGCSVCR